MRIHRSSPDASQAHSQTRVDIRSAGLLRPFLLGAALVLLSSCAPAPRPRVPAEDTPAPAAFASATVAPAVTSSATNPPALVTATAPPPSAQPLETSEAQRGRIRRTPTTAPAAEADVSILVPPHASTKLEQLIDDTDKELKAPTLSQTNSRYGIEGTDLGYSFENSGKVYFLFGDTVGKLDKAGDTLAATDATDPEKGVRLDFLTNGGNYLVIQPPGIKMGTDETPVGGINLGGTTYIAVSTDHSDDRSTDRSVLTKFTLPATFQPLRTISQEPTGHFVKMSLHEQTGDPSGLPAGGPYVFIWGTGAYRQSDAFLMIVPVATFAGGQGTLYYAGMDASGAPKWSSAEGEAVPIVKDGTLGDLSVTWSKDLGLWLMTYDSRATNPTTIQFSYASTPWGPWAKPQTLFNAKQDGAFGKFIHDARAKTDDGLAGPVIGKGKTDPNGLEGATYAPYVVERWTRLQGSELDLYYVLSTWNPYVVVLMKGQLLVRD